MSYILIIIGAIVSMFVWREFVGRKLIRNEVDNWVDNVLEMLAKMFGGWLIILISAIGLMIII